MIKYEQSKKCEAKKYDQKSKKSLDEWIKCDVSFAQVNNHF